MDPTIHSSNTASLSKAYPNQDRKYVKGDKLIFSEGEHQKPVTFQRCKLSGDSLLFLVKDNDGKTFSTFKQNLSYPDDMNIGVFPITPAQYKSESKLIDDNKIQQILNPTPLDPLAQLWLSYHSGVCKHASKQQMLRMAEFNLIPKELLYFKNKPAPLCVSCEFSRARKRSSHSSRTGPLRKPSQNFPGAAVSMDQLVSAQPGLVPQVGGHLTRDRIWAVNIAVDHYSDFHKAVLMRGTTELETLDAKLATEKTLSLIHI